MVFSMTCFSSVLVCLIVFLAFPVVFPFFRSGDGIGGYYCHSLPRRKSQIHETSKIPQMQENAKTNREKPGPEMSVSKPIKHIVVLKCPCKGAGGTARTDWRTVDGRL